MDDLKIFKEFTGKEILADALKFHYAMTGKSLKTCSEEYYIYSTVAYIIENMATAMEDEAKQNFIRFAKGQRLDLKGELYGTKGKRLGANAPRTTMRCYISIAATNEVIIPKGTRFIYGDVIFYTEKDNVIKIGEKYTDVIVVTDRLGKLELEPGAINTVVDRWEYFESCENITPVTGGREKELDKEYIERLKLIPESFTTAGSARSYEFWIKKASPLVTAVYIDTPKPNYIDIYLLNGQKLVDSEEKEKILNVINDDGIKALNDQISIKDPSINSFDLNMEYYVYDNAKITKTEIEKELKNKFEKFINSYKLGDGINTQDFIEIAKSIQGIKRVNITSPGDKAGDKKTLYICKNINLSYRGVEGR